HGYEFLSPRTFYAAVKIVASIWENQSSDPACRGFPLMLPTADLRPEPHRSKLPGSGSCRNAGRDLGSFRDKPLSTAARVKPARAKRPPAKFPDLHNSRSPPRHR